MSQNNLDKRLSQKMDQYDSPIDPDLLWDDIVDRVPKKKKRRRIIAWWPFGLATLGLLMFISYYNITNTESDLSSDLTAKRELLSSKKPSKDNVLIEDKLTKKPNNKSAFLNLNYDSQQSKTNDTNAESANANLAFSKKESIINSHAELTNVTVVNTTMGQHSLNNRIEASQINQTNINQEITRKHSDIELNVFGNRLSLESKTSHTLLPRQVCQLLKYTRPLISIDSKENFRMAIPRRGQFLRLGYSAGKLISDVNIGIEATQTINDGEAYFSHGIGIDYGYYLNSNIYGLASVSLDRSYKKFEETVLRDTIVPSTNAQLIKNTFRNGAIDTENGTPDVFAKVGRSVLNLNTLSSINIGLGIGYTTRISGWDVFIEGMINRSVTYNISGLGMENSILKINDLETYSGYYSTSAIYSGGMNLGVGIPIGKDFTIDLGVQYNHSFTDMISNDFSSEKLHNLRSKISIRKTFMK